MSEKGAGKEAIEHFIINDFLGRSLEY